VNAYSGRRRAACAQRGIRQDPLAWISVSALTVCTVICSVVGKRRLGVVIENVGGLGISQCSFVAARAPRPNDKTESRMESLIRRA